MVLIFLINFYFFNEKKLFEQYMNLLCQVFYPEYNNNFQKCYAPSEFKKGNR